MQSATGPFRTSDLGRRTEVPFRVEPDAAERRAIAAELGALELRKLRFEGTLSAEGKRDFRLEGTLGATVVQPCVVTLAPVTTRIDAPVLRRFLAGWEEPEPGSETEAPEDDTAEPLGAEIDPRAVMIEALALAMPDYPRAPDADTASADLDRQRAEAEDPAEHPFAALSKLRGTGEE